MNAQRSRLPQSGVTYRPRFVAVALWVGMAAAAGILGGCSDEPAPAKGQLVVVVQTDMMIPQDFNSIRLEVFANGNRLHGNDYQVGRHDLMLPATITLVAEETPSPSVRIRLMAQWKDAQDKSGNPPELRTVREAVTTVPAGRTAMLRMPIQWLCNAKRDEGMKCPNNGETCVAGECQSIVVDVSQLETYAPGKVFGGGSAAGEGSCLDTIPCFAERDDDVVLRDSDCSVEKPKDGEGVNVALVLPPESGGVCGPGECLVVLDAQSKEGWQEIEDRLFLPKAACRLLESGDVLEVAVTTACKTKTAAVPICGP